MHSGFINIQIEHNLQDLGAPFLVLPIPWMRLWVQCAIGNGVGCGVGRFGFKCQLLTSWVTLGKHLKPYGALCPPHDIETVIVPIL